MHANRADGLACDLGLLDQIAASCIAGLVRPRSIRICWRSCVAWEGLIYLGIVPCNMDGNISIASVTKALTLTAGCLGLA